MQLEHILASFSSLQHQQILLKKIILQEHEEHRTEFEKPVLLMIFPADISACSCLPSFVWCVL